MTLSSKSICSATCALEHRLCLCTYAEHIEGIRTIGACFKLILLGLSQLLTTLIFLAIIYSCRGNGDKQVGIVVSIDEHLQVASATQHLIDKRILLDMSHWIAKVDISDSPAHGA